ncbi:Aquaporin-1 [Emericellopsis cladophorae]|uniref:Aquaporin-1 n=1 Tax=Emericellopsis cladophorae TaxID=2686198 RepID=A0A9Q0BD74_9HYPO|nr:Aquaporin-1 [Emericellopsis cladophorae]KAI6781577.1 Aquaporin-1 [Emericellopsis cladophorae]
MKSFNLPPEAPFGGMPSWTRHIIVTTFGEFCGTFLFLFLSFCGAQTALDTNDPLDPEAPLLPYSLMYISASFGVSLALTVWVFFRATGGMFNPAPIAGLAIIATQLVAAIAASAVVSAILPGPFSVGNKLDIGTSIAQGLFLEMFITTPLVLAVLFLAVEKHHGTYLAPVAIGLAAFIAHIVGTRYTGTSINPARSFGPAVITSFPSYHWIFWLGPILGSTLAFAVYEILKWCRYEYANPGQDAIDLEEAARALEAAKLAHQTSGTASHASRASPQNEHQ